MKLSNIPVSLESFSLNYHQTIMPINPIQLFQSGQTNFLSDYMGGAQNVIGNIFDKAIQSGRDMVNNQMKQDTDLMNLRSQETALAQRRGENLQQNIEDANRNARNIFESDRKFNYVAGQDTADRSRQMNNDIFSQGMQTARFGLDVANTNADNVRADEALDVTVENQRIEREQRAKDAKFYRDIYATPEQSAIGKETNVAGMFNAPQPEGLASLRIKLNAATKSGDANAVRAIGSQIDRVTTQKPPTMLQQDNLARRDRAEARVVANDAQGDAAKAAAAEEKRLKDLVLGDTSAFVPQTQQTLAKDPKDEAAKAAATAFDKDRFLSEVGSAKNMSEDAYVNFKGMTLTPEQIAKRREIWKYANGDKSVTPQATASKKFNPATGRIE